MAEAKDEKTLKLIGALLRMPPKPHSEMKLGRHKTVAKSENRDSIVSRKKGGRRPSKHG
jgi:hypothetical protein